ncbi:hypothetical protein B0A52_01712 [Exophiala mesophila]|uniref:Phosphotransferase n=1 Tax=Exophiala mesophila TaxID=212818 RepID=A0A438NFU2_EXOME|nr:hypothetical protein B0A52_01712 [Exophiala mesophila]
MSLLDFFRRILRHLAAMLLFPSTLKAMPLSPKSSHPSVTVTETTDSLHSLDSLKDEIMRLFRQPCTMRRMMSMSSALRIQYKAKMQDSPACMLPSFCHSLPTGQEKGTFIALDVGGSTFRIALVELRGRHTEGGSPMVIKHITSFKIDDSIRRLPSTQFFDWMASNIDGILHLDKDLSSSDQIIPMGLAWSFPVEQTSHRGGKIQGMGKGFACHEDTLGKDLGQLLESACTRRHLKVRVDAILNDSSATLLSQAYIDPATSMGLILGTGTNIAAYLPVAAMGRSKFGSRDPSWFRKAERVITNTEVSMFGKSILPETRWDEILNKQHPLPDFQPLEYMVSGRYLGEIFRLIVVEAVETGELFSGVLPKSLRQSYSLDTELMVRIEEDSSPHLAQSASLLKTTFQLPSSPSEKEMSFLKVAAESISYRASAYMAVAVHALWALQKDSDIKPTTAQGTPKTSVACNGSVILRYPGFKHRSEAFIKELIDMGSIGRPESTIEEIVLEPTDEAVVLGAAVAVALADDP